MHKISIVLPPVFLIVVGIVVYIAVVKFTTPPVMMLQAQPVTTVTSSSSSATPLPDTSQIETEVSQPDQQQITAWQQAASKNEKWRLDPLEAAKRLSLANGFASTDNFSYSRPTNEALAGQATVKATHDGVSYEIAMYQPGNQGNQGIWIIQQINRLNSDN